MNDNTTDKLVILYIFDIIEMPLAEESLLDICSNDNDWIPYMSCKEALYQLLEASLLCVSPDSTGNMALYMLTNDGRQCLSAFYTRIPSHLRDEIKAFVKTHRLQYRKRQEYFSDYFKNADGTYDVSLKILEPSQAVLEINLNVPNRNTAKWIYQKWEEKAADVYSVIYENLCD